MIPAALSLLFGVLLPVGDLSVPLSIESGGEPGRTVEIRWEKAGPSRWQAQVAGRTLTLASAEGGGYWASLQGGEEQLLEAGGSLVFTVAGLPYRLAYRRRPNGNEEFSWGAAYRLSGAGRIGECAFSLHLLEEGNWEAEGVTAPLPGPLRICGSEWLLVRDSPERVRLIPATLPVPRIGSTLELPSLAVDHRRPGRFLLLDFWASWCAPCVDAFPELAALQARYAGRLDLIGINVDELPDVPAARALAAARQTAWPNLYHGFGVHEPLWRALAGAAPGAPLRLPLYAMLSPGGVLLYAGGPEGLSAALRRALDGDSR